jgi:hypothetical protein
MIVIAVRVTKPQVPIKISETFVQREVERTKLLVKKEEKKIAEKSKCGLL